MGEGGARGRNQDRLSMADPAEPASVFTRVEPLETYLASRDWASSSMLRRTLRGETNVHVPFVSTSPEMVMGEAMHAFLLEPAYFAKNYAVPRLGEPADALEDPETLMDRIWLRPEQYESLLWTRDAIERYAREPVAQWLREGTKELSIYWTDEAGRRWRARPDCFTPEIILEVKTVQDVRRRRFARLRRRRMYDLQAAHYIDAVRRLTGKQPRFAYVTIEAFKPRALWVHELGFAEIDAALAALYEARASFSATTPDAFAPGSTPAPRDSSL